MPRRRRGGRTNGSGRQGVVLGQAEAQVERILRRHSTQHQGIGRAASANEHAIASPAQHVTNRQVDQVIQLLLEVHDRVAQDLELGGRRHGRQGGHARARRHECRRAAANANEPVGPRRRPGEYPCQPACGKPSSIRGHRTCPSSRWRTATPPTVPVRSAACPGPARGGVRRAAGARRLRRRERAPPPSATGPAYSERFGLEERSTHERECPPSSPGKRRCSADQLSDAARAGMTCVPIHSA